MRAIVAVYLCNDDYTNIINNFLCDMSSSVSTDEDSIQQDNGYPLRNVNIARSSLETFVLANDSNVTQSTEDEDEDGFPDGGFKAWLNVLGSFFGLMATFGLMNSVGSIQAYINDHQFENLKNPSIASGWIFAVYIGTTYAGGIFSGILFDEFGAKIPLLIGALLFTLGLMGTASSTTLGQFIVSFGIVTGLGTAISINPLVGVVSHWFKKNRGTAIGLSSLGGSAGGMVFPLMLKHFYESVGFAWAIRILAFLCLLCFILSFLMIDSRLSKKTLLVLALQEQNRSHGGLLKIRDYITGFFWYLKNTVDFKALKDPKFLFFTLGLSLSELSLICTLTYVASYAITSGVSSSNAYLMITVQNAVGIIGRIGPNKVADIYGPFNITVVMVGIVSFATLVIWRGFGKHQEALWVFCILNGIFSTSTSSLAPVCCGSIIPTKEFGKKYATCSLLVGITNLVAIPAAGYIIGSGSIESYNKFIVFAGVLAVCSDISWILSRYFIVGFRLNVRV